MSSFQCPYCSNYMAISKDTTSTRYPSFDNPDGRSYQFKTSADNSCIKITFYKCPNCGKFTIKANGVGSDVLNINTQIIPLSSAKIFPDYIPEQIRNDYEEACAILNLSPKAAATLARRCLQGMIHDFWNIKLKNLNQEITSLKDKVTPTLWKALDSLRELGNIGAHMEADTNLIVDIDPNEAEKLIKLIERLMQDWYINRAEQETLYSEIINTNVTKQNQRKKSE